MSARRLLVMLGVLAAGCGRAALPLAGFGSGGAGEPASSERLRVMLPNGDEATGRLVSERVIGALRVTHGDVALVPTADGTAALAAARATRAAYLVAPVIVAWPAGPAAPDHVAVRLELREVGAGDTVSAVTFENAGRTVDGGGPVALLDTGFDRAVAMLMATASAPERVPARTRRLLPPDPESMDARQFPRQ